MGLTRERVSSKGAGLLNELTGSGVSRLGGLTKKPVRLSGTGGSITSDIR